MSALDFLLRASVRPRFNFSSTRMFIDRLPTRRPFSITSSMLGRGRNAAVISSVFSRRYVSTKAAPLPRALSVNVNSVYNSDFRPLGDFRQFHPMGDSRPVIVTQRGAARWVAPSQPEWERQSEIIRRGIEKAKRQLSPGFSPFGKDNLQKVGFGVPSRVVICLKRVARRQIMHALGIAGLTGLSRPHMKWHSFVRC